MTWKMELSDKMSKEFKDLAKHLKGQIADAFKENKDFISATILSFRKGSIVARFSLLFSKNDKQPLDDLKKKIKGGKLGSIDVDPESLKRLDVKQGDTASENDLPNFVIYLVIAGSVVVLVIVIALLILVCGPKFKYIVNRKKKGKGTEFNMESYGYNNPEYSEFPENKNREEKQ
ncbi:uncharacterized protein LOC5511785 isoform X1 [Nematostella vectensis]|uniref:uncharacterized protein LOC5511785 isoform X1 n=1 Tax=Nematostella vectensis TaxID=45351 RepID=UPI002077686D|nr:uncharacterized protein LOC5511785 isoform X1 [Nematostella vectensis]